MTLEENSTPVKLQAASSGTEAQVLVVEAGRDDLMPEVNALRQAFITVPWQAEHLHAVRDVARELAGHLKN